MSSLFDAQIYARFRPQYPPETYAGFESRIRRSRGPGPLRVGDLGCGTGCSSLSWLRTGVQARVLGVDPDPAMLRQAREAAEREFPGHFEFRQARAEESGFEDESLDGVLVGSAFHWMDRDRVREELARVLRPGGVVRLFEYQFPKSRSLPELDEWIRREFNLRWRAPEQRPRGSFFELTEDFAKDTRFEGFVRGTPPMVLELDAAELTGLLLSQSRVLHYEASLTPDARAAFREEVASRLQEALSSRREPFDFKLAWVEVAKRGRRGITQNSLSG